MNEPIRKLSELPDEELMKCFKLGSLEAFNMLYERYSGRILSYLRKRLRDDDAAQEVFQDTFLKVSANRSSFDSKSPFAPWLFKICRNSLVDFVRKVRLESHARQMVLEEGPQTVDAPSEARFEKLAACLSEREKTVLDLRFQKDLTFQKISQTLGISTVNVRKIASRAVMRLRGKEV